MSSWFLWWFDGGPHQASRHSLFARLMFLFFCTRLNFLIARSWNASENEFIWSWTYLIKSISLFSPLGSLDTEPRRNTNSRNCNSPHKRRSFSPLVIQFFHSREINSFLLEKTSRHCKHFISQFCILPGLPSRAFAIRSNMVVSMFPFLITFWIISLVVRFRILVSRAFSSTLFQSPHGSFDFMHASPNELLVYVCIASRSITCFLSNNTF